MAATITPNKEVGLGAAWWVFEGTEFVTYFFDITGASNPPSVTATLQDWYSPVDYAVSPYPSIDDVPKDTGGLPAYGTTITNQAELPQLEFVVGFPDYGGAFTF